MEDDNLENLKRASRSFIEAFTACSIMMVQGNFSVFSWGHVFTAASTGLYVFMGVMFALMVRPGSGKFFRAWVTGVVTIFADRLIHPAHFGEDMTEAVLTGLGAFILAIIFDLTVKKKEY